LVDFNRTLGARKPALHKGFWQNCRILVSLVWDLAGGWWPGSPKPPGTCVGAGSATKDLGLRCDVLLTPGLSVWHFARNRGSDAVRILGEGRLRRLFAILIGVSALAVLGSDVASAALPVPTECVSDVNGANDIPGQRDLT
jgi:hypothetical protein